jgi:hypothetical protein
MPDPATTLTVLRSFFAQPDLMQKIVGAEQQLRTDLGEAAEQHLPTRGSTLNLTKNLEAGDGDLVFDVSAPPADNPVEALLGQLVVATTTQSKNIESIARADEDIRRMTRGLLVATVISVVVAVAAVLVAVLLAVL